MVKHNNQLQKNHFHKDWQRRVKTWVRRSGFSGPSLKEQPF